MKTKREREREKETERETTRQRGSNGFRSGGSEANTRFHAAGRSGLLAYREENQIQETY
jgi:hypothetical protein